MIPDRDEDLLDWIARNLYSAVVSDSCDQLGYTRQALGPEIRPVDEDLALVGRARTSVWTEIEYTLPSPYEGEMLAIDSLKPGEIAVMATAASKRIATVGELMSTAAIKRGARGVVTDGLIRDVRRIRELQFPVYCGGYKPVDSKGRGMVVAHDAPVHISGVDIHPGDLIVGDVDGVVVVPQSIERAAMELAWDKVSAENGTRVELENGLLLREVYAKYGVL